MTRRSVRAAVTLVCAVAMGGLTAGTATAAPAPGVDTGPGVDTVSGAGTVSGGDTARDTAPGGDTAPGSGPGGEPALVHANTANECRLNVRSGPHLSATALTTLTCDNYTTCSNAGGVDPCGPYEVGGTYSCVGTDGTQVTDDRWAPVAYRAPDAAYVAVACAALREL